MSMNPRAPQLLAGVLIVGALCAWLAPGAAPAVAQAKPVDPATMNDFSLCDAWHSEKTSALDAEVRARHFMSPGEMSAAANENLFIGMTPAAVVCALGSDYESSSITTRYGETVTWVFRRQDQRPIIVRLENFLRVESFSN